MPWSKKCTKVNQPFFFFNVIHLEMELSSQIEMFKIMCNHVKGPTFTPFNIFTKQFISLCAIILFIIASDL